MPFEVGQFASDYEILSILGKGGMGRVYRVRNVISNRIEAMKVLLADVAAEAELGDRFLGEIRTLARLDHPNIAKFHTAFKVENQLVMVMEYVEGDTLSDRAKAAAMPLEEMLSCVGQTLDALSFAHKNGVIHRDIKPSNIMITPHGIVKLMDFGIAKSNTDPLLTRPGTTMGSMLYMSPEQVRGTSVDARSDLYSLGVVLYELTSGKRPFDGENTFAILDAQLNAPPKPPIELNPSMPPALNEIILTALDKEPMRRFQTADAFKNALETLRQRPAAPPVKAQAAAAVAPVQPRKGNRGLWMALGAAACVCVLVAAAVTLPRVFKSSAASSQAQTLQAQTQQALPSTPSVQLPTQTPEPPPSAPVASPTTSSPVPLPRPDSKPVFSTHPSSPSTPPSTPSSSTVDPPQQPAQQYQPPQVTAPAGPSQQEIDAADEALMKIHARAESIHSSLDNLRSQQASQGLGIRPDIGSSASRMDNYLSAAQRALQTGNLEAARKNMERAEEEVDKLEKFFGR